MGNSAQDFRGSVENQETRRMILFGSIDVSIGVNHRQVPEGHLRTYAGRVYFGFREEET